MNILAPNDLVAVGDTLKWNCPHCKAVMSDGVTDDGPFFCVVCNDCGRLFEFDDVEIERTPAEAK